MNSTFTRFALTVALLAFSPLLAAATTTTTTVNTTTAPTRNETVAPAASSPETRTVIVSDDADSRQTREKLIELLRDYPPQVGQVLKLDPSLFSSASYLSTYPALASFVSAHPEIAHNPQFFLERVDLASELGPQLREEHVRRILGDLAAFLVFLVVTFTLAWLVKTLIEQRRWSRQSHVQTEVHSKLLDRLTSSQELLTYIQSPAGKRFLEAAPLRLDSQALPVSAPIGRFLWSIQAGLVLAAGGFGLQFIDTRMPAELQPVVFGIGVVVLFVGIGFVLSAIVSFYLSRKLGLTAALPLAPLEEEPELRGE
jgi:hypothetical protein